MSALGQKQTLQSVRPMSALPPKADINEHSQFSCVFQPTTSKRKLWLFAPQSRACNSASSCGSSHSKENRLIRYASGTQQIICVIRKCYRGSYPSMRLSNSSSSEARCLPSQNDRQEITPASLRPKPVGHSRARRKYSPSSVDLRFACRSFLVSCT